MKCVREQRKQKACTTLLLQIFTASILLYRASEFFLPLKLAVPSKKDTPQLCLRQGNQTRGNKWEQITAMGFTHCTVSQCVLTLYKASTNSFNNCLIYGHQILLSWQQGYWCDNNISLFSFFSWKMEKLKLYLF